tara:strand:+ start:672 stop:4427 length:3756 start_codon:yes stop_codon:yes gene_type:complete
MSTPLHSPLDFPLHGSRLIEASAGTGKTYTIAALFVRLVIGHGVTDDDPQLATAFSRPLQPKNILVMTFTKAATAELADRIRARLSEAASYFRATDSSVAADDFLQALKQDCQRTQPDKLNYLARQLELAAQSMDEAAVRTIHGWCQKMLTEHAFASGSLFDQQVETDESELKRQAAEDYFRRFVYPLSQAEADNILPLLGTPEALLGKVGRLNSDDATAGSATTDAGAQDSIASCFARAESSMTEALAAIKAKYLAVVTRLNEQVQALPDARNKGRKDAAAALYQWCSSDQLEIGVSSAGYAYLTPEDLTKTLKDNTPEGLQVLDDLPADKERLKGLQAQRDGQLLAHAARFVQLRLQQLKQQVAVMGHDDMLSRLRDALRGPNGAALAATIRNQYPVAMVDEFQDTDPVQYEIFDRIYQLNANDAGSGIFLIGDPKQAIYSFRNADIFTYLQARQATRGRHYNLGTNFRSTQPMVDAVNSIYRFADEQHASGAFLYPQEIPFLPVQAKGRNEYFVGLRATAEPGAEPALQWQVIDEPAANKDSYLNVAASYQANQIAALLSSDTAGFYQQQTAKRRAVQPGDIAILVRKADEAKIIRRELALRGVRSVYLSESDSVFAQQVATDLFFISQACAQPRDPRLVRTALACQLLALPLADLVALQEDEQRWEEAVGQFIHYQSIWQQQGILAALQRVLHDYKVPKRLLGGSRDGERQLADALHIAELLQQASMTLEGMLSVVEYFAEQLHEVADTGNGFGASNSRTQNEAQQLRLESDEQLVKVVTFHKAKGLQYPLVFMPFAAYTAAEQYRYKNKFPASYQLGSAGNRQRRIAWDKTDQQALALIRKEELAENIRIMYVALTRAEFATFVCLQAVGEPQANPLFYLLMGDACTGKPGDISGLLSRCRDTWQQDHTAVIKLIEAAQLNYCPPTQPAPQLSSRSMPSRAQQLWWVASYSALKYGSETLAPQTPLEMNSQDEHEPLTELVTEPLTDAMAPQTLAPDHIHQLPKGAAAGTFLHTLLEDAAALGFDQVLTDSAARDALLEKRCRSEMWLPYKQTLNAWLQAYLTTPFGLDTGHIQLAQLTEYQAEPEFWFGVNNVNTLAVDQLISQHIFPGLPRPALQPNQLNGMLKGFIDLVFGYQGKYYVADYKSNVLGDSDADYSEHGMRDKILASRYDLQFVLYTLALHKLLLSRLGAAYDYDSHVGGALYLFLRGHRASTAGAFFHKPPRVLIEQLANLIQTADHSPEANHV